MRNLAGNLVLVSGLCLLAASSSAAQPPQGAAADDAVIDHVIVGIADLEQGIRRMAELGGVTPERGGEHPGRGTHNALLSLGPRVYLEIMAPVAGPVPGREFLSTLKEPVPIGWAIGATDLDATKSRLEAAGFRVTPPRPGSRKRPDGQLLEWRTAGIEGLPGAIPPFLIEWGANTRHPATTSPGGCTLESMEVHMPQSASLARLAAELRLGMTVHESSTQKTTFTLACPTGRVTLSSPQQR